MKRIFLLLTIAITFSVVFPLATAGGIDSNTSLMMHFDGSSGSAVFVDTSNITRVFTNTGSTAISSTQYKFNAGSAYFSGTQYITTPSDSKFNFSTGDWTIDYWYYTSDNTSADRGHMGRRNSAKTSGWSIGQDNLGIFYQKQDGGAAYTPEFRFDTNTWFHVAFVKSGTTIKAYKNGKYQSQLTGVSVASDPVEPLYIGAAPYPTAGKYAVGYMDELRITKGYARWNANFIPDTFPYSVNTTQYYAYGDSITRATGGGSLNTSGSDVYIQQMINNHQPTFLADHNQNGGGWTSAQGRSNIGTNYNPNGKYNVSLIMFGINDRAVNASYTGNETAANLAWMYDYIAANGTTPYILIDLIDNESAGAWANHANQVDNITKIQNYLTDNGYSYIKMYDSVDSIPGNGIPDYANSTNLYDDIHPTVNGHYLMSEYLWSEIGSLLAPPVASFSSNATSGYSPQGVQFTDTSTGTPTSWMWNFTEIGNGTAVTFSTDQNPVHTFTTGNYSVNLIATNAYGSDTSDDLWINITAIGPAQFSDPDNPSSTGSLITVYDITNGTRTSWDWGWGDGTANDTTQNPSHTYTLQGTYQIFFNVSNSESYSSTTGYHTVTNATGFNQQDVSLTPSFTVTMHITDSTTGAPIPVVFVQDSNLQEYTTTNGTAYFTESYGTVVFYLSATGYTSKAVSYIIDEDRTVTVQMRAEEDVVIQPIVSLPEKIQFHIQTFFGAPISDATVTAYGYTTTTGSWDWVITLLGVQLDEAQINTSIMSGSTDSNGDIEFLMLSSAKYNITTTAPGYTFPEFRVSPHDKTYTIVADVNTSSWWGSGENQQLETNITVNKAVKNSTYGFINVTYYDPNGKTTGGNIYLYRPNTTRGGANVLVTTIPITSSSFTSSNGVPIDAIRGADYIVEVAAVTSD